MTDTSASFSSPAWSVSAAPAADSMKDFQAGLHVQLIATPRAELQTCGINNTLAEVAAQNHKGFDYLPVTEGSSGGGERIVGLVDMTCYLKGAPALGLVSEVVHRLSEDNLIGANARILDFVRKADSLDCRLLMWGSQISGLITLSDLQKLPVRAALFALITHLELTMGAAIRREFNQGDGWKERLTENRRLKLEESRQVTILDDHLVDDLLFTQFDDKVAIIRKSAPRTQVGVRK